ncbi:unnamed protein product [Dracunculus medinensis]|uniref:F-box domain-containing protein n=1 Tax=Dracunculus medinensis TaxID=318479 RepID=A0A0N4UG85_DRAME|nr:unnamed protein product [Dracunculus medinensis]
MNRFTIITERKLKKVSAKTSEKKNKQKRNLGQNLQNSKQCLTRSDKKQFTIDDLPLLILAYVVSFLNRTDQSSFMQACKLGKKATQIYWHSLKSISIKQLLKHTFERINPHSLTSLHTTRHELTYILTMIPTRTICSLDFRFIVAIHISTLQHFEKFFEKTPYDLFGSVKLLDLRGCMISHAELEWFSRACPFLSFLYITELSVTHENRY